MTITQFDTDLRALAERASTKYPADTKRIAKALLLALNGHVHVNPDSTCVVTSQADPEVVYRVAHGTCDCPDAVQHPETACKHRYAAAMVKRAQRPRITYRATYKGDQGQAIRDEQMRVWFQSDATDEVTRLYDHDRANLQLHGHLGLVAEAKLADLQQGADLARLEAHKTEATILNA